MRFKIQLVIFEGQKVEKYLINNQNFSANGLYSMLWIPEQEGIYSTFPKKEKILIVELVPLPE